MSRKILENTKAIKLARESINSPSKILSLLCQNHYPHWWGHRDHLLGFNFRLDEWHIATRHPALLSSVSQLVCTREIEFGVSGIVIVLAVALSNDIPSATLTKSFPSQASPKCRVPFSSTMPTMSSMTLEMHFLLQSDFGSKNSRSLTRTASKGVAAKASHAGVFRGGNIVICVLLDSLHLRISH